MAFLDRRYSNGRSTGKAAGERYLLIILALIRKEQ
jgi:hypothetical protein